MSDVNDKDWHGREQRLLDRIPFHDQVELSFADFGTFKAEYAENISLGGMFLATEQPVSVNSTISFRLTIRDIEKQISGKALVVWSKEVMEPESDKILCGIGLKFIELDGQSSEFIREFVEKHTPEI